MIFSLTWLFGTLGLTTGAALLSRKFGVVLLSGLYVGSLVLAIVIAGKIGELGILGVTLSASIFIYSSTFLITDVISEVYGKDESRKVIASGFLMYFLLFFGLHMSIEWSPAAFWPSQAAYEEVIGTAWRVSLASICAFVVAQINDIWIFHYLKQKTNGKYLWLRNNVSTLTSQALDTVVFYTIAFYGVFPIFDLIVATYIVKVIISLIDTPFVYLISGYLKRGITENSRNSKVS